MIQMIFHPPEPAKPGSGGEFFTATAAWAGRQFTARTQGGVTMALARKLLAAGCDDQPWQATRGEMVVMRGPSLARLAAIRVADGDDGPGPRFTKYQPHHLAKQPDINNTQEAA
jgi:hypothetical protein